MPPTFDPYRKWLGIPETSRPPNHYELLGVPLLENDADVIHNAADARMGYVRTFANGPHSAISQTILNELSQARIVLCDREQKLDYDARLRSIAEAGNSIQVPTAPTVESISINVDHGKRPSRRRLTLMPTMLLMVSLVVLAGLIYRVKRPGVNETQTESVSPANPEPDELTEESTPSVSNKEDVASSNDVDTLSELRNDRMMTPSPAVATNTKPKQPLVVDWRSLSLAALAPESVRLLESAFGSLVSNDYEAYERNLSAATAIADRNESQLGAHIEVLEHIRRDHQLVWAETLSTLQSLRVGESVTSKNGDRAKVLVATEKKLLLSAGASEERIEFIGHSRGNVTLFPDMPTDLVLQLAAMSPSRSRAKNRALAYAESLSLQNLPPADGDRWIHVAKQWGECESASDPATVPDLIRSQLPTSTVDLGKNVTRISLPIIPEKGPPRVRLLEFDKCSEQTYFSPRHGVVRFGIKNAVDVLFVNFPDVRIRCTLDKSNRLAIEPQLKTNPRKPVPFTETSLESIRKKIRGRIDDLFVAIPRLENSVPLLSSQLRRVNVALSGNVGTINRVQFQNDKRALEAKIAHAVAAVPQMKLELQNQQQLLVGVDSVVKLGQSLHEKACITYLVQQDDPETSGDSLARWMAN